MEKKENSKINPDNCTAITKACIEFENSDKSIMPLFTGTGTGKGFALGEYFAYRTANILSGDIPDGYSFYLADRNEQVKEKYDEFIQKHSDLAEYAMLLPSILNNIADKTDELQEFYIALDKCGKKEYEALKKKTEDLVTYVKAYSKIKVDIEKGKKSKEEKKSSKEFANALGDVVSKKENDFRDAITRTLQNIPDYPAKEASIKKYNFLVNSPIFSPLLRIYPILNLPKAKVVFLTMQKALYPINTVLYGVFRFTENKTYTKNSVFFIDESDAAKDSILKHILEDASKFRLDAKSVLKNISTAANCVLYENALPAYWESDTIKEKANAFKETYNALTEQYCINSTYKFDESYLSKARPFLYSPRTETLVGGIGKNEIIENGINVEKSEIYIIKSDENNLLITDECPQEGVEYFLMTDIADDIRKCIALGCTFIKAIVNENIKNEQYRFVPYDKIYEDVVGKWILSDDSSDNEKKAYVELIKNYKNYVNTANSGSNVFYETGFDYIALEKVSEIDATIKYYFVTKTPEKWLVDICRNDGRVILSSATSTLINTYGNFDLKWTEIKDRFFEYSDSLMQELIDYVASSQCYSAEYINNLCINKEWSSSEKIMAGNIKNSEDATDILADILAKIDDKFNKSSNPQISFSNMGDSMLCYSGKEKYKNRLKDISETCPSGELYDFYRTAWSIACALNTYVNGGHVHLAFAPQGIEGGHCSKILVPEIKKILTEEFSLTRKIEFLYVNSENLSWCKSKASQNRANEIFTVMFTPYATMGKGTNIKLEISDKSKCLYINDRGKENLKEDVFEIDIDSVSLQCPTYNAPGLNNKNDCTAEEIMSCCYYVDSLFAAGFINGNKRAQTLSNVVGVRKEHPVKGVSKESEIARMIALLIQAVGRIGRRGVKCNKAFMYIDKKIFAEIPSDFDFAAMGLTGGVEALQSIETKCLLDTIHAELNNVVSIQEEIPKEISKARNKACYICNNANILMMNSLEKLFDKNDASLYRELYEGCRAVELHQSDYDKLTENQKKMYVCTELYGGGDDYYVTRDIRQDDRTYVKNVFIKKIKPASECMRDDRLYGISSIRKKLRCANNQDIVDMLRRASIDISSKQPYTSLDKIYILTPKGFDVLIGKIGEAFMLRAPFFTIGEEFAIPDDLLERADHAIDNGDCILAFDAKFYFNQNASLRDLEFSESLRMRFFEKAKAFLDKYGKPCKYFIINANPNNNDWNNYKCNYYSDGVNTIYTVPALFTNSDNFEFNKDAATFMIQALKEEAS